MKDKSGFKFPRKWRQTCVTLFVNLFSVHMGAAFCWLIVGYPINTMMHVVQSKENVIINEHRIISRKYDKLQRFLLLFVSFVLPLTVYLNRRFGRKVALAVSTVPVIMSYLTLAATIAWIEISMMFGTIACIMQFYLVPIYVHEMSSMNIRGAHGIIRIFFMGIGMYLGYCQPEIWLQHMNAISNLIFPMLFLIGLKILPESPVWLMEKGRTSDARRVLKWLRRDDALPTAPETTESSRNFQNINENNSRTIKFTRLLMFFDLFKTHGLTTTIIIGQAVIQINCMATYFGTEPINWSPQWVIAINVLIHTITCLMTFVLIEYIGRRCLLIISCIGMTVSLSLLAGCWTKFLQDYVGNAGEINIAMTVISSTYIIFYYLGVGTLPSIIALESIPVDMISYGYAITMIGFWIGTSIVAEFWEAIMLAVDTSSWFFGQALISGLLLILSCFLTETKTN